jgi:ketosteroid isomerase-like protein
MAMKQLRKSFATVFLIFSALIISFLLSNCSGQSLRTREMLISPQRELINYALASGGATAESPDNDPEHPPSEVIDGDTSSLDWDNGGGWAGNLSHLRLEEVLKRSYIQVNLPGKKQVKQIVVYTIDSPKYPAQDFGLSSYRLEYWHGTGWEKINVAGDSRNKQYTIRDNKQGKIVHDVVGELVTNSIRLVPISSNDIEKTYNLTAYGGKPVYDISGAARVMEIEVWCYQTAPEVAATEKLANLFPLGKTQPSPDEQAIRKILTDYEQGYDNKNLEQVMSGFSEEFMTLDGKSRADIEEKAAKFFNEYSSIDITLRDLRIEIAPTGETATAEANYTLECIVAADGNLQRRSGSLTFNFRKEEEVWKIVSAK